jgi:ABC-type antimicrobial peptide transport system permease subunit
MKLPAWFHSLAATFLHGRETAKELDEELSSHIQLRADALGAQRTEVLQAALGPAFKLLAAGSVAGLLLGLLATRVLAYIVYQASPRDPLVLTGVVLMMALLGLLATWIPAQRALSVDPLILLREE